MTEPFILPVTYKDQEINFEAAMITFGYSYRIEIMVNGQTLVFEPDEERNFRACLPNTASATHLPDAQLLKAIADALENNFRG